MKKKSPSPVTAHVNFMRHARRLVMAARRAARATGQAWWTEAMGQEHAAARAAYNAAKVRGFRTGVT